MLIENQRTHQLAGELSSLTGETPAQATEKALEERIERERDRQRLIEDLKSIARDYHRSAGPGSSSDHRWLYDEFGLPK
jgi:hypothetical protein